MDKNDSSKESPLGNSSPREYQKPLFEKSKGMVFTAEIWEKFNGGRFCLQCSGCHGCV
ncbi:hypothetical protein ES707_00347 [subsurface metagenome]